MNYQFKTLSMDFLKLRMQDFISLAKNNIVDEYWNEDHFLLPLNKKWEASFYVEDESTRLIGFLIVSEKEATTHIHKFVVDSNWQRKGLGTEMLHYVLKNTRRPVTLKVDSQNDKAISFYKKHGFSISQEVKGLYEMILNSK